MGIVKPQNKPIFRNHSNALPRYIIAYDSETNQAPKNSGNAGFMHTFRLGVAIKCRLAGNEIVERETAYFNSTNTFWQWLYSQTARNYTTWLVCHNALFDMVVTGMSVEFEQGRLTVEWPRSKRKEMPVDDSDVLNNGIVVIESPPTIIAAKCSQTQGRIVIIDTMNYFATSLRKLGVACGLHKLEMPAFSDNDAAWARYCHRDCEIVFSTFTELVKWERQQDFGMFRYTAPSQAMSAFRHRFMQHNIYPHSDSFAKKLERQSYFGGRTEVWKIGEIDETVHQLDINSLFPSVMRDNAFPWVLRHYENRSSWSMKPPDIDLANSICEVSIETQSADLPRRNDRGVIYPVGRFITTLAGPELSAAHKAGEIRLFGSWAEYETAPLFENWVSYLWGMRQRYKSEGNELYNQFAKRLLNSLYGKFGQRSARWVNVKGDKSNVPWSSWTGVNTLTQQRQEYRSFGWQVQRKDGEGEIEGSFVAISSFVTSYARKRMNVLRSIAGQRNVLYQGVDGLIVTSQGRDNLDAAGEIDESSLGKLRLQLSTNHGEIYGVSDYRLADKVVLSGRSSLVDINEIGDTMQRKFSVASELFNGQAATYVVEDSLAWSRQTDYWKGVKGKDGWVSPLALSEDESFLIGGKCNES